MNSLLGDDELVTLVLGWPEPVAMLFSSCLDLVV